MGWSNSLDNTGASDNPLDEMAGQMRPSTDAGIGMRDFFSGLSQVPGFYGKLLLGLLGPDGPVQSPEDLVKEGAAQRAFQQGYTQKPVPTTPNTNFNTPSQGKMGPTETELRGYEYQPPKKLDQPFLDTDAWGDLKPGASAHSGEGYSYNNSNLQGMGRPMSSFSGTGVDEMNRQRALQEAQDKLELAQMEQARQKASMSPQDLAQMEAANAPANYIFETIRKLVPGVEQNYQNTLNQLRNTPNYKALQSDPQKLSAFEAAIRDAAQKKVIKDLTDAADAAKGHGMFGG